MLSKMEELKAISSIDHPLCYPVFLERQRKNFSGPPHMNGSTPLQKNGVSPSGSLSTLVSPRSIEDKALYTYERQRIVDLCNAYAYTLDSTMMDLGIAEDWANLFTDDCVVTYPFGTHHGKASLAKFGMKAESRFKRMVVSCLNPALLSSYAVRYLQTSHNSTYLPISLSFLSPMISHMLATLVLPRTGHTVQISRSISWKADTTTHPSGGSLLTVEISGSFRTSRWI